MAWAIEFLPQAAKDLARLDRPVSQRILRLLRDRLAPMADPRSLGEALRGPELGKYWKYRLGDYRLICSIQDGRVTVVVVRIGHRGEVYRKR
jgi:mRNA interferase RelE/StbE